jgi:hypothetical protein
MPVHSFVINPFVSSTLTQGDIMPTVHIHTPSSFNPQPKGKPAAISKTNLEGVIVLAATGDRHAGKLLKPVIRRIARSCAVYLDEVDRITASVLMSLGRSGRPQPTRAVVWLENVVRAHAKEDFFERWLEEEEADEGGEEDPPDE